MRILLLGTDWPSQVLCGYAKELEPFRFLCRFLSAVTDMFSRRHHFGIFVAIGVFVMLVCTYRLNYLGLSDLCVCVCVCVCVRVCVRARVCVCVCVCV